MSGDEQDNEYLKRSGLDACRVDEWLVEEVVDQLSEAEDCYDNQCEPKEAHIKSYRNQAAVFDHEREGRTDSSTKERSHVWDNVENAGKDRNADGCVESQPCYKYESQEVDDGDSSHFNQHSGEVSCKKVTDVGKGIYSCLLIFIRDYRGYHLTEEMTVLYKEETDEADRE